MTQEKNQHPIRIENQESNKAVSANAFFQAFEGATLTPWMITFLDDKKLWIKHYENSGSAKTVCPYEFLFVLQFGGKKLILHQMMGSNVYLSGDLKEFELKNLQILACAGSRRGASILGLESQVEVIEVGVIDPDVERLQIYINSDDGDFFFSYIPQLQDYARTIVAMESKKKSVISLIRHLVWGFVIPSCESTGGNG